MKQTTWSKLRELWAIRNRCKEIEAAIEREDPFSRPHPKPARRVGPLPRPVLAAFSICFLAACLLHVREMWLHGWLPYQSAPLPLNCYWTGLLMLDFVAALLLLRKPRLGLTLALLIMASDVAVNFFARVDLHLLRHARGMALLGLQLVFLGLVSAALGYVRSQEARQRAT